MKNYSHDFLKGISRSNKHTGSSTLEQLEKYKKRNIKERRQKIIDLTLENQDSFQYFVTLTFNDDVVGEYSHERVICLLKKWLHVQRQLNKGMCYVLVAELHVSGRLHFHGLFGNVPNWKLLKAYNPNNGKPIIKNGMQVYNIKNYNLGFTTLSFIRDREAVCRYVSKYITKELLDLKFSKNYWRSRNLKLPRTDYYQTTKEEINEYYKGHEKRYENTFERDGGFEINYYDFLTSDNLYYVI